MGESYLNTQPDYENIEFDLTNGSIDYDLDAQQSTFLAVFNQEAQPKIPTYVEIRTNFTISVRLNSTSGQSITITSTDSPYVIEGVKVRNMFITNNSGSTAAVKLRFQIAP